MENIVVVPGPPNRLTTSVILHTPHHHNSPDCEKPSVVSLANIHHVGYYQVLS